MVPKLIAQGSQLTPMPASQHNHPALTLLRQHPLRFARQGAVVATWRTHRGRRLGPYYRLAYREDNRQRSIYLGRQGPLVDQVRRLLGTCQADHRFRCQSRRSRAEFRKRVLLPIKQYLEQAFLLYGHGLYFKGWEIRGIRNFIAWRKLNPFLHDLPHQSPLPDFAQYLAAALEIPPSPSNTARPEQDAGEPTKPSKTEQVSTPALFDTCRDLLSPRSAAQHRSPGRQPGGFGPDALPRARAARRHKPQQNHSLFPLPESWGGGRRSTHNKPTPPPTHPKLEFRHFVDQNRPQPQTTAPQLPRAPPHQPAAQALIRVARP